MNYGCMKRNIVSWAFNFRVWHVTERCSETFFTKCKLPSTPSLESSINQSEIHVNVVRYGEGEDRLQPAVKKFRPHP